ncbi:hypothetical protein LCGC14_0374550 [marine sediment metagenome]|uniref:Uncharacterized protein n=1 Tax=marine sediment metagenome TaxID=412755 RepID=A0A0F9T477_9ZZZZ
MKKEKNNWKTIGIVCIVLLVLETLLLIYVYNLGTDIIENENECVINVCRGYESYYYETTTKVCSCYNNNEIEYEEYLGG